MTRWIAVLATLAGAAITAASLTAQERPKNIRDGVYTADQALRGKSGYDAVMRWQPSSACSPSASGATP